MMEEKPSTEEVLSAISALHNNPAKSEKERASQWLLQLQKSVHAWTVADELLHLKRDTESCYFAAQTMRTKIHQHFYELPLEVHSSLRDSLLSHVSQINEATSSVIVTQLSVALADLALQMPSWNNPTIDLISKFSQTNIWSLLEVLTVLPEELDSRSMRLGENRRKEVLEEFKSCAHTVNEFLQHCLRNYGNSWMENVHINEKIFKCFISWVSVGAFNLSILSGNMIITRTFDILSYKPTEDKNAIPGEFHEIAADCISTLLRSLEKNNNQMELENWIFSNIVNLELPYHLSVANEDQGKSMNYCRLFTELAESFLEKIIHSSSSQQIHYSIKALDLVLNCVGHHDYEVAELTLNVWYVLSEELYQKNNKELTEHFKPYIERLITALCKHCQMEPDCEGILEDGDEFRNFRLRVADLIKDVVFIVGSSSCFRQMFMNLQTPAVTWDVVEAALYVMQAVAKNVLPTENEVIPKVVEAIINMPEKTHVAVKYTSILLLGELCDWIEKHLDTLDDILNFLVYCLPQAGIGAAAATALQNICSSCNDHMPRHMPVLLQLLHQVDTFAVPNGAVIGLLKGVAFIISHMPHDALTSAMRELCFMQLNPLCLLLDQDVVLVRNTRKDPVLLLDRLSSILRYVTVTVGEGEMHPCKPVALEIWPILSRVFDKYQDDVRVMERSCRVVRFMLRCVSQQVCELLESLVRQIIHIYSTYRHSCFLYVGSILVDEYGTDVNCVHGLLDMLQAFLQPTFLLLQEEDGFKNHPDTVDDFFRLCARFIQRAPIAFMQSPSLVHILQCALSAATLDHKEANMSVMKFFYDLINQGQIGKNQTDYNERVTLVKRILEEYGQQLVTNLIHSCVYYLHAYMLSEVADVIIELLEFDRQLTSNWLSNGLDTLPKNNIGGIMVATPEQLNEINISITRSSSSKSVTHALRELTRFYR